MALEADVERALAARQCRRVGDEIRFLCPSHDDHSPSAEWNRRKAAWNCPVCGAGGTTRSLAQALGLAIEEPKPRAEIFVCGYEYRDADGRVRFRKARYVPKRFGLETPDSRGGWLPGMRGTPFMLYRLPELLASDGRVFIVEGEKDADALAMLGLTATTWPEGAQGRSRPHEPAVQKYKSATYNPHLAGREVVILPDNDEAGTDAAAFIAASLQGVAASVRVLMLPDLPAKGDVSDWLLAGGTRDELEAIADASPVWVAPAAPTSAALFELSDAGNAELFAHLYGDRVRFDHLRGRWLVWDRHRWVQDPDGALWRLAVEAARVRKRASADLPGDKALTAFKYGHSSENTGKVEAMLKQAKNSPPIADPGTGWDANPMLLACTNGVINLATGEFRDGRREDRITQSCGLAYEPAAACPTWLRFLGEVFQGDREMIAFVQRAVGYTLTAVTREQVWFLCFGDGANGKSKFLETVLALLGGLVNEAYGADTPAETLMRRNQMSGIPADVAALAGKRFVICSESDNVSQLNTSRVKSLTGGDPQTARFMRENFFTFTPVLKLWFATNYLPRVNDPTDGYWRRVIVLPFLAKFEGSNRDPMMGEKLRAELVGILNWAVQGSVTWARCGLQPPEKVLLATLDYKHSADPLGEFKTERCICEPGARATPMSLYAAYRAWCDREGISEKERLGRNLFLKTLEAEGFKGAKSNGIRVVMGIRLREDGEQPDRANVPESTEKGRFSDSRDEMEGRFGLIAEPIASFSRDAQNVVQNVPSSLASCDCDARHDDVVDCDGRPYWLAADESMHCGRCHPDGEA